MMAKRSGKTLARRTFILILLFVNIMNMEKIFSQDFIPRLSLSKSIQQDSDNFYFNAIWIQSKDINSNDASGFLRRAAEKTDLGYYKEAIMDVNSAISIDSTFSRAYSMRGFIRLKTDSVGASISDFKKAIILNDSDLFNYQYYAEACLRTGNLDKADSLYSKAISIDDKSVEAHFGLANVMFLKDDYKKAEDQYKRVLKINPAFPQACFNMAIMYMRSDHDKAMRYFNKTLDISPGFAPAYFFKGYLDIMQLKLNQAEKNWSRAIELDSLNALYRISNGFLKISLGNYTEGFEEIRKLTAISKLKNYLDDFEKSTMSKRNDDFLAQAIVLNHYYDRLKKEEREELIRAMCMFAMGRFNDAEQIYQKQLAAAAFPGLVWYLRGFNFEYFQQPDLSLNSYQKASVQSDFPKEVYLRQGIINIVKENYRSAITSLKKYIESEDSSKSAYVSLGNAYMSMSDFDSAVVCFDKALTLDVTSRDVRLGRAFCFKHLKRYKEAIADYEQIPATDLDDVEPKCIEAECYYASGDTTGAFELLNKTLWRFRALTDDGFYLRGTINLWHMQFDSAVFDFNNVIRHGNHQDIFTLRGLAYYCTGHFSEAKSDFTQALIINRDDLTALYTLGMVNLKLNEPADAYAHLIQAESLGHPLARRSRLLYLKDYKPPGGTNTN
jgi:tetratricopeptide (TPR) repeat protein